MLSINFLEVEPIMGVLQELSIRVNKGVCPFNIVEVCENMDGNLFFIHGNMIRNPSGVRNGVNEVDYVQFLNFGFVCGRFGRMDGRFFWHMGATSGHVSMWCSTMDGSNPGISV